MSLSWLAGSIVLSLSLFLVLKLVELFLCGGSNIQHICKKSQNAWRTVRYRTMPISGSLKYGTRWHYEVALRVFHRHFWCFSQIPNLGGCPIKPLCFLDPQKKITFFLVFLSKRFVCFLLQKNNALRKQRWSACAVGADVGSKRAMYSAAPLWPSCGCSTWHMTWWR